MKKRKMILLALAGLGIVFLGSMFVGFDSPLETEIAVIPIRGGISPVSVEASPRNVREQIKNARSEGAEAFLFEINSPGGTVVASSQLEETISDIQELTVCQFNDYATSGAYWAASACDKIVADPLTITGALGVTASYLEYTEFMDEYGIKYIRLEEGDMKGMGSPYKNLTEEERIVFKNILNQTHTKFIQTVSTNRKISDEDLDEAARGKIFTGKEGLEIGLVDYLGGRREAEVLFEKHFNETVRFREYRREQGLLDLLFGSELVDEQKHEKVSYATETDLPKLYALG